MPTYDLSVLSADQAASLRGFRRIYTGGAVALAIFLTGFVADIAYHGRLLQSLVGVPLIIYVALGGGIVLCAIMVWKLGAGAIALSIEEDGFRLGWTSGRSDFIPWSKLRGEFVIYDYSANEALRAYTNRLYLVQELRRPISALSKEAFEGLLSSATTHGLLVDIDNKPPPWVIGLCQVVRIHSPNRP